MTIASAPPVVGAPLLTFASHLRRAGELIATYPSPLPPGMFAPAWEVDPADPAVAGLLTTPPIRFPRATFEGTTFRLLDLMGVPGVSTTKAWASLLMVARAVTHVRATGENVLLVTPTSGNKGSALRHAVAAAVSSGCVTPEQVRIATMVPQANGYKVWANSLDATERTAALNPVFVCRTDQPADVKKLALDAVAVAAGALAARNTRAWYTLDLRNYYHADAVRACVEARLDPPRPGSPRRVHAHAVSSAYGLLGYEFGRTVLRDLGELPAGPDPSYLLVQHLSTCDMVLHGLHGSFDRANLPSYDAMPDGTYRQTADPRFPYVTSALDEEIDPTFYSREPATAEAMTPLLHERGGSGIVVSRQECLTAYPRVRALCDELGVTLPADPADLREWSLVIACTGVLTAQERGLLDPADDVVIHGSGTYTSDDYQPVAKPYVANGVAGVAAVLAGADG